MSTADLTACRSLYVSSDLMVLPADDADHHGLARDLTQVDSDDRRRAYRKLDITWLAWLETRMHQAWRQHESGRLSEEQWQSLLHRYRPIKLWARQHLDVADFDRALLRGPGVGYQPPKALPSAIEAI